MARQGADEARTPFEPIPAEEAGAGRATPFPATLDEALGPTEAGDRLGWDGRTDRLFPMLLFPMLLFPMLLSGTLDLGDTLG